MVLGVFPGVPFTIGQGCTEPIIELGYEVISAVFPKEPKSRKKENLLAF